MNVGRRFLRALYELGVSGVDVVVIDDIQEFIELYQRHVREMGLEIPGSIESLRRGIEAGGEFMFEDSEGRTYVWLSGGADDYTVYHAAGHLFVKKHVGIDVIGYVKYEVHQFGTECVSLARSIGLNLVWFVQNLLGDILVDLALKDRLGGWYWEGAQREMERVKGKILAWAVEAGIHHSSISYLLHLIDAVYKGEATARERRAMEEYMANPTRETGKALLDELVDVGRKVFEQELDSTLEGRVYRVTLYVTVLCAA